MVARGAGAAEPVLLACRQWDPLGLARRVPSLGVGAWRCAPLLPWRVQCPIRVCAALAAGSGGSGRYLASCLSRFPLPAPRVPRCVWRAVLSGCPLPSLAGTPFHAVCAFRALGPVALPVVPACPFRVCALALSRCPPPPPWVVWRAHPAWSQHWALVGPFHVVRAPPRVLPRSLAPSGVLGGGRSGPGSPLLGLGLWGWRQGVPGGGAFYRCVGRLGSCTPPPPTARPLGGLSGSAIHVLWARACGCGGPALSLWGLRAAGRVRGVHMLGGGLGGGGRVRRTPRSCGRGGACRAGGRSASFRPSAFPGQATKRASLALCYPWGAWPPIPLRFVLTRLRWVRSVRCPGAQAWARLFSAAPMGAGGWGGGAGRTPAPLSGGAGPSPLPRGVGAGAPAACGPVGGRRGGGGVPPWPPCSPSGRRPAVLHPGPLRVAGAFPSGVRVRSWLKCRPGVGGDEGRPGDRSPGGPSTPEPPLCHP